MAHLRAFSGLLLAGLVAVSAGPAQALEEADRLMLVGEKSYEDGLYALSRRTLERFLERFPGDKRAGEAILLLGKARLAQGSLDAALEAFRKTEGFTPVPGKPQEARFWEAETLYRLKRFTDARAAYARVISAEPASPLLPDALYSMGWADLELKRRDAAALDFGRLVMEFPDHSATPSAAIQLARALIEMKRADEAIVVLEPFPTKYPEHRLAPEARYYLARARLAAGDMDKGVAELRAFARANPGHELAPAARRVALDTQIKAGKKKELAEEYAALLAQKPPAPEGLYDAGAIAAALDRPRDADAAWARLRKEFPEHVLTARASLEQAQAAFGKKNFKDAAALGRAASKSPEDAVRGEALLVVGESEMKLRHPAQALPAFQAAADTPGLEPALHFRALAGSGLAQEDQKQWAQAAKYYEEVAERSPDKTLATWAKTRRAAIAANLKPAPRADKKR
ncbi:MAG TPA: tetratricopeptide repeat protein [Methylomirabilota bacterium]|nr:tetratricopeptide repeat protein [Methylomirabilota bacterium]